MKPVYKFGVDYAREHGELVDWRESRDENEICRLAIESEIRKGFDGWTLDKKASEDVVKAFGIDRVLYVLANTVQRKMYDGRFDRVVKQWAESVEIGSEGDCNTIETHPVVLNGFIRQLI